MKIYDAAILAVNELGGEAHPTQILEVIKKMVGIILILQMKSGFLPKQLDAT